ncbi:unnamed protein product [Phytomonas sp. Hart1]|nr:unnamed protein product [Phytomonas sp. Hart1]|eukprot:CCW72087.1 unnamed protein product [Phytomonas sp. isolate Hart1]
MVQSDANLIGGNIVRAQREPESLSTDDQENSKVNPNNQPHKNEEKKTHEKGFIGSLKKCLRWISLPFGSKYLLGVILIICVAIIWVASSMWIQYIFGDLNYNRPYFLTYFNTTLFSLYNFGYLFMPSWRRLRWRDNSHHSTDPEILRSNAELARFMQDQRNDPREFIGQRGEMQDGHVHESEPANPTTFNSIGTVHGAENAETERVQGGGIPSADAAANHPAFLYPSNPTTVQSVGDEEMLPRYSMYKIWHCAMFFCFYWFAANYLYNLSLSYTDISSNAVLSSTTNIWTLLFSYLILHKRVGMLKCFAVVMCVGGSIIIAMSDSNESSSSIKTSDKLIGDVLALVSAFFYSVYTSVLSKCLPDDDRYSMFMVFGAVGTINLVCFWPGLIALNSLKFEIFTWPSNVQFWSMLVNSLIGTNLSDILWARSVVLASPVIATLGVSLTSPFSMIADAIFNGKTFSGLYVSGALMVMSGFVLANVPKINFSYFKRR